MATTQQPFRLLIFVCFIRAGFSLTCYQCSSGTDPARGPDSCGAGGDFKTEEHFPIECNSTESYDREGTSCVKITYQNRSLTRVTRRCASPFRTGTKDGCHSGFNEMGDWIECYCSQDKCNGSGKLRAMAVPIVVAVGFYVWMFM